MPKRFESEKTALQNVLEPWLAGPIEHVGSTAVPGLIAKPTIDIMAAVGDLDSSRPAIEQLRGLGYGYFPHRADRMHWLCKPSPSVRTHHLHLVPYRSRLWRERILFRDELRRSVDLARRYAELKLELAARFPFDRESYTIEKWPFVREVVERLLGPEASE